MTGAGSLEHVLWIGGPPASGKTTVASTLARTYGLRLYSTDTRTWSHRDRALAAGEPAALRWEALSPGERWDDRTPQDLVDLSLHHVRGPMVLDDVRSLPMAPLVVVEGSVVPPWVVSSGVAAPARALWLLPTADLQDRLLASRGTTGSRAVLHRSLRELLAQEAAEHGAPTLVVDGSGGVEAVTAAVGVRFADALAEGPRAADMAERRGLLREANLDVVGQVRAGAARLVAVGAGDDERRTFACECGRPGCLADVELAVGAAADGPVLTPGHA